MENKNKSLLPLKKQNFTKNGNNHIWIEYV